MESGTAVYTFGDFVLDLPLYELRRAGEPCPLEPQVFDVLAYLVRHHDRLVSKDELMNAIWGHRYVTEAGLNTRIMAARKVLGDTGQQQQFIRTIRSRGYRFIAAVVGCTGEMAPAAVLAPLLHRPPTLRGQERSDARGAPVPSAVHRPDSPSFSVSPPPPGGAVEGRLPLVGREVELEHLRRHLGRALAGRRQVVFVTGEAGLGKTALIEAFRTEVRQSADVQMARGQCLAHRGAGEPYLPLLDALGRVCREPGGETLVGLLNQRAPTWLVQMPWLVPEAALPALEQRVLGVTRERMLREMGETFEVLTAQRPLVLVLEDLHWCDPATLDLLSWLARRPEAARLLVIGTCCPADPLALEHPLREVIQELRVRGFCDELAVSSLTEADVQEYLQARFPGAVLPDRLPGMVRARTGGNPLFIRTLSEAWITRGLVCRENGGWQLRADLEELAVDMPESLRELIEQQFTPLAPIDQQILETASVAGIEFSTAAVAAATGMAEEEVESRCTDLARSGRFLRGPESEEWADGTVVAHFHFLHHLYPEVLYDRVPPARRARQHRAIGARLETGFGSHSPERAAELAAHFVRGRDGPRAVKHLQGAAEHALQRSADREALGFLNHALELLSRDPEMPEGARHELRVQSALGPALVATQGWAAPAAEAAYRRARELAEQLNASRELSTLLYRLAALHEFRGQYVESQALLEERLCLLDPSEDTDSLIESQGLLACTTFHQGLFARCVQHAEQGIALYDPQRHLALTAAMGGNPGVACRNWSALALWFLGFPDQALARTESALALAEDAAHSFSLANAQQQAACLHQHRGEAEQARARATAAVAMAEAQGYVYHSAAGTVLEGWALAALGDPDQGIRKIHRGLAACQATGAVIDYPYYLALLADACRHAGRPAEGLEVLEEACSLARASRGFFYEAELHRLRAALLLRSEPPAAEREAEAGFLHALELARKQGAKSLELRAATSLSQLWYRHGRGREARELLESRYDEFTEGLATDDLWRARALLERWSVAG
jgi:predicted ATPase/DNA-binding winged helix-turn-helix (wHTH) protein